MAKQLDFEGNIVDVPEKAEIEAQKALIRTKQENEKAERAKEKRTKNLAKIADAFRRKGGNNIGHTIKSD